MWTFLEEKSGLKGLRDPTSSETPFPWWYLFSVVFFCLILSRLIFLVVEISFNFFSAQTSRYYLFMFYVSQWWRRLQGIKGAWRIKEVFLYGFFCNYTNLLSYDSQFLFVRRREKLYVLGSLIHARNIFNIFVSNRNLWSEKVSESSQRC